MSHINTMIHNGESTQGDVIKLVKELSPSKVAVFEKAYNGKSLKAGIKSFCLSCQDCKPYNIRNCESKGCSLWNVRPYQEEA